MDEETLVCEDCECEVTNPYYGDDGEILCHLCACVRDTRKDYNNG